MIADGCTGVRLSTPEDCDLRFYSCGDASLTTGSQLRIVITARGRCWSRSVYRAGRFSVLRWGAAAAHGRPGTAIFCPSGDTPAEMPQAADAKGKHRRSLSTSSRGAPRCFPPRRYLLPSPPGKTQPSLPSAPARAPRRSLRPCPARPGAITARRRPATGMPPWRNCGRWARCGGGPAAGSRKGRDRAGGVIEEGPVPPEGIVVIGARPGAYAPGLDAAAAPRAAGPVTSGAGLGILPALLSPRLITGALARAGVP